MRGIKDMKIGMYYFPDFTIFCVGEDNDIIDLDSYIDCHTDTHVNFDVFINRTFSKQSVHAYAKGENLYGKIYQFKLNRLFKKKKIYVNENDYTAFMLYISPDIISKYLGFSENEVTIILEDLKTRWGLD